MNRFKELRIQHGYKSQKELADVLFVNQTAVSQWERGATTPSNQMLKRLSELYHVSTDYLLEQTDDPLPMDKRAKPTPVVRDEQDDKAQEEYFMDWFRAQPPAHQKEVLFDLAKAVNGQE